MASCTALARYVAKNKEEATEEDFLTSKIGQFYCSNGIEFHTFCRINKQFHKVCEELFLANNALVNCLFSKARGPGLFGNMPEVFKRRIIAKAFSITALTIGPQITYLTMPLKELNDVNLHMLFLLFPNINKIAVKGCRLSERGFCHIAKLSLRELSLTHTDPKNFLLQICKIKTLETLSFKDVVLPENICKLLGQITNLKNVTFSQIRSGSPSLGLRELRGALQKLTIEDQSSKFAG